MTSTTALTPSLRQRLDAVARRIRLLRLVRGLSLLALVQLLTATAAMLADYLFSFPVGLRLALFAGWLALGLATLFVGLVLPLCRRLDHADLAAVIEQKYPQLAERLLTSVALAGARDVFHGSPALIALLVSDTAQQTSRLDFLPAVSARRALAFSIAAGVALLLVSAPAVLWTREYAHASQRFFCAWNTPPVVALYELEVPSGAIITARGRPVVFSVRVQPLADKAPLPKRGTLVLIDATGQETRLPMVADRNDAFSLSHKVTGDGRYRIEAGDAVSANYDIQAIVPVELAENSPAITVQAPPYARETILEQNLNGLVDLSALRHSEVHFALRFTRPAVIAHVEWSVQEIVQTKDGSKTVTRTTTLPLVLAEDRCSGTLNLPAQANGTYRLVLAAEHGIRTELDARTLTVRADQPPQVVRFAGKEELQALLPYDRLPLEIVVGDDVGVAQVDLEYTVNNGEARTEGLTLAGANRQEMTAKHLFTLAGKVREGDEVRYRLRVQDNLPREYGGPNVIYYPAERWLSLKVARKATPLREQEILAQRDDVETRLEAIETKLKREQRAVAKVREESRSADALSGEQAKQVQQLQQDNRAAENALRELANEANATPALEFLAEKARDLADQELRQSEAALQEAAGKKQPPQRDNDFAKADASLTAALKKLELLKKANEKVAQGRLDQQKLEMLADREKQLAARAAELAVLDPVRDPLAQKEAELLKREQAEAAAELQRLSAQSESLRNALDDAHAEQAKLLGEKAQALAEAERELAKAMKETNDQRLAERFAELARKQQELADKADKLAEKTRPAAETAKITPLKSDEARKAATSLKDGNAEEAIRRQSEMAHELDRLAAALEQAKVKPAEVRELAKEQRALREEVRKLNEPLRAADNGQPQNPLGELARQQEEIAKRATALAKNVAQDQGRFAPTTQQAQKAQQTAQQTADKLQAGATTAAQQAGKQTAETLRRLAQDLAQTPRGQGDPSAPDPVQQAKKLAQQQEDLNRKLAALAESTTAQRAQQLARDQELERQTDRLAQDLTKLGQQMDRSPEASSSAQQAAQKAQQARAEMQQARNQQNQGDMPAAQQAQEKAAKSLDRAALQAAQAAQQQMANRQANNPSGDPKPEVPSPSGQQAGQAVEQAQNQMTQAQAKLNQGQPQGAQAAMQQAAQALQQAAQQLAAQQADRGTAMARPGDFGTTGGGNPDPSIFGPDAKQYAGKPWGELPGELRTRIVQDMMVKYGDDYARMIKLYFEQIADTKKK